MSDAALDRLAPFVDGGDDLNVIVETPSGSRIKYDWDPARRLFEASKLLPLGLTFPYEFGFVPSTKAADGDPLDALVISDAPLAVGCLVECRVLGALEIKTSEHGDGKPVRNDRLIVVPTLTITGARWRQLGDLGQHHVDAIRAFLQSYVEREGRRFELVGQVDRAAALALVRGART